jgi:hypothetical protein
MLDVVEELGSMLDGISLQFKVTCHLWEAFNILMKNQNKAKEVYGANLIKPFIWTITAGRSIGSDPSLSIPADNSHFSDFTSYISNNLVLTLHSTSQGEENACQRNLLEPADLALKACHELNPKLGVSPMSPVFRQWIEAVFQECHLMNSMASESAISLFERLWAIHTPEAVSRFQIGVLSGFRGRKYFVTSQGYMGIGPSFMQPGDKVCLLFGGATPYIIRSTSSSDEFLFVGECYIHGLMDGEAIKLCEDRETEPQYFHLR